MEEEEQRLSEQLLDDSPPAGAITAPPASKQQSHNWGISFFSLFFPSAHAGNGEKTDVESWRISSPAAWREAGNARLSGSNVCVYAE